MLAMMEQPVEKKDVWTLVEFAVPCVIPGCISGTLEDSDPGESNFPPAREWFPNSNLH